MSTSLKTKKEYVSDPDWGTKNTWLVNVIPEPKLDPVLVEKKIAIKDIIGSLTKLKVDSSLDKGIVYM